MTVSRALRQLCLKEREHIRVELPVERDAVEARRIGANLRNRLRQRGRAGRQEREMHGVGNDVVFVLRGQAAVHDIDAMGQHAVATELRRPQLHRDPDRGKAVGGKHDGERVGDDGGLDARIVRQGLCREFPGANLIADPGSELLAKNGGLGPIRIGADHREAGVTAP